METNPVQFNMNPTQKKRGQQKLFETQRWSRGFSPQRMRDVSMNIQSVQTPQVLVGEDHPFMGRKGQNDIREVLARSTMPASKMQGANVVVRSGSERPESQPATVAGLYRSRARGRMGTVSLFAHKDHSEKYGQPGPADIAYRRHLAESTLIHEMGHHRSNIEGLSHSAYDTDHRRGLEEGYADNHASHNWVMDKRDSDRKGNLDRSVVVARNSYGPGLKDRSPDFQKGYKTQRGYVTQPAQFDQGKLF